MVDVPVSFGTRFGWLHVAPMNLDIFMKNILYYSKIFCYQNIYSAYHQIVTFCDFLENLQKLSTKNTTKLENSSNSYGFLNFYRNYLVVGTVVQPLETKNWKATGSK